MARPRTFRDLQNLADIAKKREDARASAKLAKPPKTYRPRGTTSIWYFKSVEDENIWVSMPVFDDTVTFVTPAGMAALGGFTGDAAVVLPAQAQLVNFASKNQDVLRVKIHDSKATPTEKNTPWGTRVVDKIDKSYGVPMSITGSNGSLAQAKVQFRAAFAGVLADKISKKGNYAELYYGKKLLATVK